MSNLNKNIEEGLKEFDEKYTRLFQYRNHKPFETWKRKWDGGDDTNENWITPKEIKSFFRTFAEKIYKKAREEAIEEIEVANEKLTPPLK